MRVSITSIRYQGYIDSKFDIMFGIENAYDKCSLYLMEIFPFH